MARRARCLIRGAIRCASCGRWTHEDRFSLGSDEFTRLIGLHTAAGFGRPWREIAEAFGLDPEGRVMQALATRDTWSGITLNWPVDGGGRLPVELSGLPIFDTTAILPAIAVLASAAISTALRAWPRCGAMSYSAGRRCRGRPTVSRPISANCPRNKCLSRI